MQVPKNTITDSDAIIEQFQAKLDELRETFLMETGQQTQLTVIRVHDELKHLGEYSILKPYLFYLTCWFLDRATYSPSRYPIC